MMVRFTVLASGSKGNSSIVTYCPGNATDSESCTRILIDAGLSCRELFRRMRLVGEDPASLDAIVITHEHQDHINGLAVTARKLGIPVYFTEATHRAWVRQVTPRKRITYAQWAEQYRQQKLDAEQAAHLISRLNGGAEEAFEGEDPASLGAPLCLPKYSENDRDTVEAASEVSSEETIPIRFQPAQLPRVEYFRAGESFSIGDISISPFTIPHDAADPVGFVFSAEGVRLAVATDLGYMPPNVQAQLRRCDLILLESNHDLEMLRDGPYPWSVKQRVLSRVGHLSNEATSNFLEQTYDGSATYLILAHLSESNNSPELARIAAERALISKPSLLANRLLLATQHDPMDSVCF